MKIDTLINEAERLKKEAIYYRFVDDSETADGYWIDKEDTKFALSLNDQCYVFKIEDDFPKVSLINDIDVYKKMGKKFKGIKGFSYPGLSFLFYFGSKEIQDWLADNNWEPDWGYNDNFKDKVADDYYLWWQDNYLLFTDDKTIIGASNCWIEAWPEDDEPILYKKEATHLITTLYNSEPYFEIYKVNNEIIGFERIT
jgi:hypothetical protein